MSRGLMRSFVVVPTGTGPEERAWLGSPGAPNKARPDDYAVDEDGGFLYKLRTAAGLPLRFLGRILWFAPVILLAKLVMGAFDRRASDILVPIFASLVTLFFASVSLWVFLSFVWWVARGRHQRKALLVGEPAIDLEAFEGIATPLSPGSSVLAVIYSDPHLHFAQLEAFAVVREGAEPIVVVPKRMPRALGDTEAIDKDLVPPAALEALGDAAAFDTKGVIIRPGDRVRVRGERVGDVANAESFEIDGTPAALVSTSTDGAYRQTASQPAILVGDGPTRRLVVEKLGG